MLVSFDTMALIWLTKQGTKKSTTPSPHVAEMHKRAYYMHEWIEENGHKVMLSTIVVSEYLRGVQASKRNDVVAKMQESYTIVPFDVPAAKMAADLYDPAKALSPPAAPGTRPCLKADVMIVASVKIHQVTRFFSNDATCRKYAELCGMQACDLPVSGTNLFSGKT